jgi:hypothetical protein
MPTPVKGVEAAIEKFRGMAEVSRLEAQSVPGTDRAMRLEARVEAFEFCADFLDHHTKEGDRNEQ